jgi:predicted nucleic acid-binding protein
VILVDTSVWIEHFRRGVPTLVRALDDGAVLTHPFVIGEITCGRLGDRAEILDYLGLLPQAVLAEHDEALALLERRELAGQGLGWVDVHLLASARLSGARLWTLDRTLQRAASQK